MLNQKKIDNINKMSPLERYEYFLRKISDFEEVWGLKGATGWLTVKDADTDRLGMPVWPEKDFALNSATGEWSNAVPEKISLDVFLEKWLPGLAGDNRFVSVFPINLGKAVNQSPTKLLSDIKLEMQQYE